MSKFSTIRSSASSGSSLARSSRVPAGILSDLIVSQRKGAPFSFRQPLYPNHRHLLQAEQNRCSMAAAPGNDVAAVVDQDWHQKAECGDTVCDLADLLPRMSSRVARIWFKRVDRDPLHCYHVFLLLKIAAEHTQLPAAATLAASYRCHVS